MKKSSKGFNGGGNNGCGAFKYSEISGSKSMSSRRGCLTEGHRSSGGSAPQRVITHIAGLEGKGALQPSEIFGGGSKMSSKHGTNGQSKDNNMVQGGKDRIGEGVRGFKSGIPGEAGPRHPIVGHVTTKGKQSDGGIK